LTRDENKVAIVTKIHYTIADPRQYLFSNTQPLQSLQEAIANATNQTLGKFSLEQLLTASLPSLQQTLQVKIDKLLSLYTTGLALSDIELQPIQVPNELKASFDAFNQAQTEKEQLENKAKAYAMQIQPKTQGEADQLIEDAKSYQQKIIFNAKTETARFLALLPAYEASPVLTRKRLYLAAMQAMMQHSNKMLIDTPNNISLYVNSEPSVTSPQKIKNIQTSEKPTVEKSTSLSTVTSSTTNNTLPSSYNIAGGYE
jgi:modulator of FtsH protease HflK